MTDAPGFWLDDATTSDGWCLSSETAGLDIVGAEYVRDVEPGEIVVLEAGREPRSVRFAQANPALCVFELIYFARPDSYMEGRNLYEARRRMGMELAREHPAEADLVMPVPDTGAPAAAGYAEASGIPYREGLVRNRYTGRTFIQPSQTMRQRGVTIKLNPLREVVRGRRLTVVDDSIVRGTTTKQIVELLRKAGAAEVHVRISAPPIYHPCFYGIDTQVETELIAATNESRRSASSSAPTRSATCRSRASSRRSTCRTSGSASPASTAATRSRSRTTRRAASSSSRRRRSGCRDDRRRRKGQRGRAGGRRRAGVDVAAGERAVELMRGQWRRRAGRRSWAASAGSAGRWRSRPGTASRSSSAPRTAWGPRRRSPRRSAASTRSGSTSSRCAPTTSSAPAPSRCCVPRLHRGRPARPGERRRARRRRRRRLPRRGCALVGGETAEHPGLMERRRVRPGGVLRRGGRACRYLDGTAARAGDAIVGLAASGLHANGFSLVRGLLARYDIDLRGPYQEQLVPIARRRRISGLMAAHPEESFATLGHVLLTPTTIYARAVLGLRSALEAAGHELAGVAHITGGGLPGNVPRALPAGLGARLDPDALADAVGHAPLRRPRRARGRRAAGDVQRGARAWWSCSRAAVAARHRQPRRDGIPAWEVGGS